jgi:DNA-directed RNA polymerase subunit RPC12/RpoP
MKWYKYKCTQCGWDSGEIRENDLKKKTKGSCPKCGDGHSYPNKIAFNLFEQLNINFIPEYSPKWIKPKRYDFYFVLNNNEYIVEMDGGFHNSENHLSGKSLETNKSIDEYKNKLAILHNVNIIRIDCSISDLDFIKSNILASELNNIVNLNNINWLECQKFASHSRVYEACEIFNQNNKLSPKEIGLQMKLSNTTVRKFLKIGNQLGICNYNVEKACKDRLKKAIKSVVTIRSKKVICLNTLEIFNSISIANLHYNCCKISECCNGKRKSSGKHPVTGESLRWMYYEDYMVEEDVI